jgi:uncharacterized membrane protein YidH (DUF202 family)
MKEMARSSRAELAGAPTQPGDWRRADAVLLALTATALVLIVVQFALAGFGAFTMDKTPTDNVYKAHDVVGVAIAATALLTLVAALTSRSARAHSTTLRLAVTLAVLALILQPVLGTAGTKVPALGALHGLNALVITAVTGWLARETVRRRAAAAQVPSAAAAARGRATGETRADPR